jgi:mRNA-degrading endonuclease RelE of RelBE toxin-antitoxin system
MGSTASDDDWDWSLSPRAENQFAQLEPDTQERIVSKLDDVVSSEWRDPDEFLEPVLNSPFQKLRVGDYRLGCRLRRDDTQLRVESIRKREGAYKADD